MSFISDHDENIFLILFFFPTTADPVLSSVFVVVSDGSL